MHGWLLAHGHHVNSDVVMVRNCRQLDAYSTNFGVSVCLWSECYVRGDSHFWRNAETIGFKGYRARIACNILMDSGSKVDIPEVGRFTEKKARAG